MAATSAAEIITVDTDKPFCDGGDGPLGHPRVYLTMNDKGSVDCPYCGRHFVLNTSVKKSAAH